MLIERLCFVSPSNEQVRRLFMFSIRGQRSKVKRRGREYLDRSILWARERHADSSHISDALTARWRHV